MNDRYTKYRLSLVVDVGLGNPNERRAEQLILNALKDGGKRWRDFEKEFVDTGKMARGTLSNNLKRLIIAGKIRRVVETTFPSKSWYELTESRRAEKEGVLPEVPPSGKISPLDKIRMGSKKKVFEILEEEETYGTLLVKRLNNVVKDVYPPFCKKGEEMCKLMAGVNGDELSALRLKLNKENEKDLVKLVDTFVGIGASFGLLSDVYDHVSNAILECERYSGKESSDEMMRKITMMEYLIMQAITSKRPIREFLERIGRQEILNELDELLNIRRRLKAMKADFKRGDADLTSILPELKRIEEHLKNVQDAVKKSIDVERNRLDKIIPIFNDLFKKVGVEERDLVAARLARTLW